MEEGPEGEAMGSRDLIMITKGRRTKRQWPPSPLRLTVVSSSFSSSGGRDGSPTVSPDFVESTEEEEDMANCLILLAQGKRKNLRSVSLAETGDKVVGLYVYQCKTCRRCFSSFQALGGHRASHNKPSSSIEDDRKNNHGLSKTGNILSLQIPIRSPSTAFHSVKPKVHKCSVCGAEFSSGQALGGHMRRHRTLVDTTINSLVTAVGGGADNSDQSPEFKKERKLLQLDLNLPAPEDDHQSKPPFSTKEQQIIFSRSPMVDCHH